MLTSVPNVKTKKCVIYTAIVDGYDDLPSVDHPEEDIDYICFCDKDIPAPFPWTLKKFTRVFADPQRDARRIKLLPHLFLPEYSVSLWVDATVHINKCPSSYMVACTSEAAIACAKHPERDCLYEEAKAVLGYGVDDKGIVLTQMDKYKHMGTPSHGGLHVTTFLFRRHHSPECRRFSFLWWQELSSQSKRDQLSFDFVRWVVQQKMIDLPYLMDQGTILRWGERDFWHKAGSEARMLNRRFWAFPSRAVEGGSTYYEHDVPREFLLVAQRLLPYCSHQPGEKLPLPCSNGAAERRALSLLLKDGNQAMFCGRFSPLWLLWAADVADPDLKLTLATGDEGGQEGGFRALEVALPGKITFSPATVSKLFQYGINRWLQRFDIIVLHVDTICHIEQLRLLATSMPSGGRLMLWGKGTQHLDGIGIPKAFPLVRMENFFGCSVFEKKAQA